MRLWQAVVEYHGLGLDLNLLSSFVLVSQFPSFVKWRGRGEITVPNPQHGFAVKQRQLVGREGLFRRCLAGQGLPRVRVIAGGGFCCLQLSESSRATGRAEFFCSHLRR